MHPAVHVIVEKVMEEEVNNMIAYCQIFPP